MEKIADYEWVNPKDYEGYEKCKKALKFTTNLPPKGFYHIAFYSSEHVIINTYLDDKYYSQTIISTYEIQALKLLGIIRS